MSMYYLTGSKMNAFGRGTVTVSPTDSTIAPKENLYDSDPSTPHVAGSNAYDAYMQVYLNVLTNPGFETSTLSGWYDGDQGTGVSTETVVGAKVRTGAKACGMSGGTDASNYGSRYQDFTASAGEYRRATVYVRSDPLAGSASLYLYNLKTGHYYDASGGGSWGASRVAAGTALEASFTAITVTYRVEDFETCRADTVTMRFEIAGIGTCSFDDCSDVPGITFAGIFGHNYGPVVPLVRSSDDASSWTTRATMTIKRPAFYSTFSILYHQYWRILLYGANHEVPYTGEAVLGQYSTATSCPEWGLTVTSNFPGIRNAGPTTRVTAYNFSTDASESIRMTFESYSIAEARELSNYLWMRSAQGMHPTVIALTDTSEVYYGRLSRPFDRASPPGVYACSLELSGDPMPTVGL